MSTGSDAVRHIQRWPGRTQANENKVSQIYRSQFKSADGIPPQVPTLLIYAHGAHAPSSWGFLAETAQEQSGAGHESREWFKIMLDEQILEQMRMKASDPSKIPQSYEVEKWYVFNHP